MYCENCRYLIDEDNITSIPLLWQLVKTDVPYLLPFYYCHDCFDTDLFLGPNQYEHREEANRALLTELLCRQ